MALRDIVKVGDSILREKCKQVTVFDDKLGILLDDMLETMKAAEGVGLAAPQVGVLKRVVVVSIDGEKVYELINPVIIKSSGKQCGLEGCLSVPNKSGYVERPKKVTVEAFDRHGKKIKEKAEGFLAVAFSHEIDHLDGILYIDKIADKKEEQKA